ncbi:hypothetical protein HK096_011037, partial [Nowakowskiella sp. JEL0078]
MTESRCMSKKTKTPDGTETDNLSVIANAAADSAAENALNLDRRMFLADMKDSTTDSAGNREENSVLNSELSSHQTSEFILPALSEGDWSDPAQIVEAIEHSFSRRLSFSIAEDSHLGHITEEDSDYEEFDSEISSSGSGSIDDSENMYISKHPALRARLKNRHKEGFKRTTVRSASLSHLGVGELYQETLGHQDSFLETLKQGNTQPSSDDILNRQDLFVDEE